MDAEVYYRAKMILSKAVVSRRKNEFGEWVVRAYDENGKRYPAADYFTTDKADAEGTALAMVAQKAE